MNAATIAIAKRITDENQIMAIDRLISAHIVPNTVEALDEAIEFIKLYRNSVNTQQTSRNGSFN